MRSGPHRRPKPLAGLLIAFALLLAQGLALLHGVVHPRAGPGAPGHHADAVHPAHGFAADALWPAHDESSPVCLLLDQLAHADGIAPEPPALPRAAAVAEGRTPAKAGEPVRRPAAYFARAPPLG